MNKYLAAALPVTVLLVVLAFFLPAQLSQWNDQKLLDDPVVLPSTAGDLAGFAEGVSLTVPEKLLLLRSGRLSAMEIPQELEQPLIIQEGVLRPGGEGPGGGRGGGPGGAGGEERPEVAGAGGERLGGAAAAPAHGRPAHPVGRRQRRGGHGPGPDPVYGAGDPAGVFGG